MITLCGFAVSGYYNKLKLFLLEKDIPFRERLVYPWERDSFAQSSPLGKIPFVETEYGALSESQVILEFLEERYPEKPMYPKDPFARAKCRELIQHLELNAEWVARRLYKESFFGGAGFGGRQARSQGETADGAGRRGAVRALLAVYLRRLVHRRGLCRLHAFPQYQDYDAKHLRGRHARPIFSRLDGIHPSDGIPTAPA